MRKKPILIPALIAAVFALSGCEYARLYNQYAAACSMPENQRVIEVGDTRIPQGCAIQPPQDVDAKWVSLGGTVGTVVFQEWAATRRAKETRRSQEAMYEAFTEGFRHAGPHVGGNAVIGDGASGFDMHILPDPVDIEAIAE